MHRINKFKNGTICTLTYSYITGMEIKLNCYGVLIYFKMIFMLVFTMVQQQRLKNCKGRSTSVDAGRGLEF
jgi:hypothetical protein